MAEMFDDNPFEAPEFLEGLEAAGYLQRLDVSEQRITARFQHALQKMSFAAHSEEFLTRAGVRRVHGSTVQFFNDELQRDGTHKVSDPFVHILVGSLPSPRQALVTPVGCATSGWTPIGSKNEQRGTMHFTVSHTGFWPFIVVLDSNSNDAADEDRWAARNGAGGLDSTDSEDDYVQQSRASRSRRGSRSSRAAPIPLDSDSSDSEADLPPIRRSMSAGGGAARSGSLRRSSSRAEMSRYADTDDLAGAGYGRSASRASRRGSAYGAEDYATARSSSRASRR